MLKTLFITLLIVLHVEAIEIIQKPIIFDKTRIQLTQEYQLNHYNIKHKNITIVPKIIMIHHTASDSFESSFNRFEREILFSDRVDIVKASRLNVSAHFLISQEGKIYQLMPEDIMARHVIGLNHCAIGIENVGGEKGKDNLTKAQLQANIELISYLTKKYKSIKYLSGHYEYTCFEKTALWLEINKNYRTIKHDPSPRFMQSIYTKFPTLLRAPCD